MKQDNPVISRPRQRKLLRPLLALALAAGLAAAGWWFTLPRTVTVVKAVRGPAIQAVYATGTVEATVTIRVAAQVAGRLFELMADEGQTVKAGDVLARLDDSDLRASVSELEARATYAAQQFERAGALVKQGWATKEKYDQSMSEMDAARQASRRASELLRFMQLKTPADGVIIRRDGEVGDYIPTNQPVFYLAKAGVPLRISADVDEEDIPLVKVGQKVLIRSDAFPSRVFNGRVAEITPKGDPVARSYRVRVELPSDTALMIGMTAETNIVTAEKQDALLVPASAVSSASLWAVRNGKLDRVAVQVGIRGRDRVEVSGGLAESDMAVIDPPEGLRPGETVRIRLGEPVPPQDIKR
ncbi:MAG: efflux RND transporter periplasmic adaptor subunit [Acetobacteraceae bacterium]